MSWKNNPYITRDIALILEAYTVPGQGTETTEGGQLIVTHEGPGIPGSLGGLKTAGGQYSYAAAEEKLQGYMDSAKAAVDTFYGYGTNIKGEPEQILGVDFRNTATTVAQSGNIWEAGATMLADCIPCKDRIMSLLSLNPLSDFWDALDIMYTLQVKFLVDLWDFLLGDKSIGVFADFCSLLQFLNFMCVPDIKNMIMVLSQLIAKYTADLAALKITMQELLGKMFGSTLAPLLSVFDKYMQLIVAPVECVINELDKNIQRLDILEAWQVTTKDKKNQEGWFEKWDGKKLVSKSNFGTGLLAMRKRLKESVDYVDAVFDKLNKDIKSFLGAEDGANKQIFDISSNIEQISQMVGLLQAIVVAIAGGGFTCKPGGSGQEELENFVNNFVAPITKGIDIEARDGIIKIAPSVPDDLDGMNELLDIIATYKTEPDEVDSPVTTPLNRVPEINIPVSNCLYTVTDNELDKVRDFLSTFE